MKQERNDIAEQSIRRIVARLRKFEDEMDLLHLEVTMDRPDFRDWNTGLAVHHTNYGDVTDRFPELGLDIENAFQLRRYTKLNLKASHRRCA